MALYYYQTTINTMTNTEETNKSLDKIISTAQDIKRNLTLLSDKQRTAVLAQKNHEIIDDRMTRLKKDSEFFIEANSIIDNLLLYAGVTADKFFKKDNLRIYKRHRANDRAKDDVIDARRVFCNIFSKVHPETIGNYINLNRSTIITHKRNCINLLETDKKFREYHEMIIKKLNLEVH